MNEFPNPNQDPGAERRILLAFVLTFLVILAFQPLLMRSVRPQQPPVATEEPAAPAPAAEQPAASFQAALPPRKPAAAKQAEAESDFVVENELYRITFSNRGGAVRSWVLKKYANDKGEPLDLVHAIAAPQHGYPLSLWTYDTELRQKLNEALFVSSAGGDAQAPAEISFEFADERTSARKTFRFDHSYVVEMETEVIHDGAHTQAYPAWPAGFGDQTVAPSYAAARVEWQHPEGIERRPPKKVSGGETVRGPFYWAGPVDQYFAAVFLPEVPEKTALVTLHDSIRIPKDLNHPDPAKLEDVSVLGAAVGDTDGLTRQRLFVGPKALDVLQAVRASLTRADRAALGAQASGPDLEGLVDFGFFGIIARPLFLWLKWTYEHWVSNWGWSIAILTLIINIALFPLRLSTMRSALKMQKIAPQIKAIQEKYRKYKLNDPRKQGMQQELGALYKKEGVNPIGGCFPMLLQLPFLFAFYTMLIGAIELRHARWLWIPDLSAPDPWYLLPIFMMVSMYYLQRLTPSAGMDPVQQKMLQIMMPLMLGGISITLSSGLVLYWATGNLIMIIQQMGMNRTKFGREVRAEMEKRAAKKDRK